MGSSAGHIIAGTFISIFGFWLCLSALYEAVRGNNNNQNNNYDDDYLARVFYNRPRLVTFAFVCTLIGILSEWPYYPSSENNGFTPPPKLGFTHISIYGGYSSLLLAILLERQGYLPRTSILWWNAVANYVSSTIWRNHAKMQYHAGAVFHNLVADVVLIGSLFSILGGMLALIRHKRLLPIVVIITLYFLGLHGLLLNAIAFYYYDWRRPFSAHHQRVEEWEPTCVFALIVFTSLWALVVFWNCVKKKEESRRRQRESPSSSSENWNHDGQEDVTYDACPLDDMEKEPLHIA